MENKNQPWKKNLIFDNEKMSAWKIDKKDKDSLPGAIMEIDIKSERMFETRVYGMSNVIDIKILAKQNLKSGAIEIAVLKQNVSGDKVLLGRATFGDENVYSKRIKEFESMVPFITKVVTTKEEYAKAMENYEK